jgi:hypothetical protein
MASSFTTNKSIEQPSAGSYNNDWNLPVNADWAIIDAAFGGTTSISVTGVTSGTYALSLSQYQPPNLEFTGTLSGNLVYVVPSGVGGIWTVNNATTGSFTISIGVSGGGSSAVLQGFRTLIVSDGSAVALADTSAPAQAQANAESFATAADAVVLANSEAFASNAAGSALTAAMTFAQNANHIDTGIVNANFIPLIGNLRGVIIQADPGGTPSGVPGTMWFYY